MFRDENWRTIGASYSISRAAHSQSSHSKESRNLHPTETRTPYPTETREEALPDLMWGSLGDGLSGIPLEQRQYYSHATGSVHVEDEPGYAKARGGRDASMLYAPQEAKQSQGIATPPCVEVMVLGANGVLTPSYVDSGLGV